MIINNWYVAAESTEVIDAPVPVRMLGCDFVLFRNGQGEAACLSSVCCHRGGSLGRGTCAGGRLRCPYHGWEFNGAGQCTRIPPLGDDARIPRRARVDSYPVEERYGYIWVFLGDLPAGQRPGLPHFLPAYGDTQNWRMVRMKREWNANWARIHENLLDTAHLYLVHSFGRHLPAKMKIWPVEKTDCGGRVIQKFSSKPTAASRTAVNQAQAGQTRDESTVTLDFSIIGLMHRNAQQMSSGYDQVIWNCLTPVDANRTRNYGLQFRNFQMDPKHDDSMLKTISYGLDEDAAVIEHLEPRWPPENPGNEMWMATDAMERLYRDRAADFARRLGRIDGRRLEDLRRDRVLVIPSPARREEPGQWLHDTVPLMAGLPEADATSGAMGI